MGEAKRKKGKMAVYKAIDVGRVTEGVPDAEPPANQNDTYQSACEDADVAVTRMFDILDATIIGQPGAIAAGATRAFVRYVITRLVAPRGKPVPRHVFSILLPAINHAAEGIIADLDKEPV